MIIREKGTNRLMEVHMKVLDSRSPEYDYADDFFNGVKEVDSLDYCENQVWDWACFRGDYYGEEYEDRYASVSINRENDTEEGDAK